MYLAKRLAAAFVFFTVELGAVLVLGVALAMGRIAEGHAVGLDLVRFQWEMVVWLALFLSPLAWAATWMSRRAVRAPSGSNALL